MIVVSRGLPVVLYEGNTDNYTIDNAKGNEPEELLLAIKPSHLRCSDSDQRALPPTWRKFLGICNSLHEERKEKVIALLII